MSAVQAWWTQGQVLGIEIVFFFFHFIFFLTVFSNIGVGHHPLSSDPYTYRDNSRPLYTHVDNPPYPLHPSRYFFFFLEIAIILHVAIGFIQQSICRRYHNFSTPLEMFSRVRGPRPCRNTRNFAKMRTRICEAGRADNCISIEKKHFFK